MSVGVVMTLLWWDSGSSVDRAVPRSVPMLATGICLLGQIAARSMWRLYVENRRARGRRAERLVVVGAGEAAERVLRMLRSSSDAPFVPVAMVDDDPAKRNLRMHRVRVEGVVDDVVEVAERFDAHGGADRRAECRQFLLSDTSTRWSTRPACACSCCLPWSSCSAESRLPTSVR